MPQKSTESNASCMIKWPECPEPLAWAVIIQSVYWLSTIVTVAIILSCFRSRSLVLSHPDLVSYSSSCLNKIHLVFGCCAVCLLHGKTMALQLKNCFDATLSLSLSLSQPVSSFAPCPVHFELLGSNTALLLKKLLVQPFSSRR